jgi:hypothetical protein
MYSYFTYKVTNPEVLLTSKKDFRGPKPTGDLYWGDVGYGPSEGRILTGLYRVIDGGEHKFLCGFSVALILASCDKKRTKEESNRILGAMRHTFQFLADSWHSSTICEFDNSQVYMIKNGERVQLDLVNQSNTEVLEYSKVNLERFGPRAPYVIHYRTP